MYYTNYRSSNNNKQGVTNDWIKYEEHNVNINSFNTTKYFSITIIITKGLTMKQLLLSLTLLTLGASCGRVESIPELLDFTEDSADKSQLNDLERRVDGIEDRLDMYHAALMDMSDQVNNLDYDQDQLSQTIALNVSNIAALENKTTVKRIIDPCGDSTGNFDESLIELSDGKILGYFEQGSRRYITVLPIGNYMTTDAQRCRFSITSNGYQE